MIRIILLVFSVLVFLALGFSVITGHPFRWEMCAFAAFVAAHIPFSEVAGYVHRQPAPPAA